MFPFCLLPLTYTGLEQRVNQREDKSFEAGSQEAFHQLEERNAIYIYSCIRLSRVSQVALVVKKLLVNEGDIRDMGLGRCPGEGNGNPLQYSCLENPMDRGAWRATEYRVAMSQTRLKWLSRHTQTKQDFLPALWEVLGTQQWIKQMYYLPWGSLQSSESKFLEKRKVNIKKYHI